MKIDGGCHCGNITYTAEVDPRRWAYAIAPIAKHCPGRRFALVFLRLKDTFT